MFQRIVKAALETEACRCSIGSSITIIGGTSSGAVPSGFSQNDQNNSAGQFDIEQHIGSYALDIPGVVPQFDCGHRTSAIFNGRNFPSISPFSSDRVEALPCRQPQRLDGYL
jgi:hypothetical protein